MLRLANLYHLTKTSKTEKMYSYFKPRTMSPLFPLQPLVSCRGTSSRLASMFLCITRQTLWRVLNAEGWRDGRTHRYIVAQIQKNTVRDSQLPRFKIHFKNPFNSAILENNHNKLWGSGGDSYSNSLGNWRLNWYETVLVQFIKHCFHEVYTKKKGRGFLWKNTEETSGLWGVETETGWVVRLLLSHYEPSRGVLSNSSIIYSKKCFLTLHIFIVNLPVIFFFLFKKSRIWTNRITWTKVFW